MITRRGNPAAAALIAADQLDRLARPPAAAGRAVPAGGDTGNAAGARASRAAVGAPIRDDLEDRRLEYGCRLLVDSQLDFQAITMGWPATAAKKSQQGLEESLWGAADADVRRPGALCDRRACQRAPELADFAGGARGRFAAG